MKINNILLHYYNNAKHRLWVSWYLFKFSMHLFWRAQKHDLSKYLPSEAIGFSKIVRKRKDYTYISDKYEETLKSITPSIDLHYKRNSHHPEHYIPNGIRGMNLVDFVEMWCDWQAAIKVNKDGDLWESIQNAKKRFTMQGKLAIILENEWNDHNHKK